MSQLHASVSLDGSPYTIEATGRQVLEDAVELQRRADRLRQSGKLTEATLRDYFGDKRFEQIAESNAIEGSTLSIGETELAVGRGITLTGHDPAYSTDAINLSRALEHMRELAGDPAPTDCRQVKELHSLVMGGGEAGGLFRSNPVRISGSPHTPPATWGQVMTAMEELECWSREQAGVLAVVRAVVLHAWLTHVHPFSDGNGRTARAVMNLEFIRAGLPSVIIRRKDRLRYYEALAESDTGGDLEPLAELILARAEDSLRDLERAAKRQQGYDAVQARLRAEQERRVAIWNDALRLLFSLVDDAIGLALRGTGDLATRWYEAELSVDDYVALSQGDSEGNSWLFRIDLAVPGLGRSRFLAWTGYRSAELRGATGLDDGPSVFWSIPDPAGNRMWWRDDSQSPGVAELTLELPSVDRWVARLPDGTVGRLAPSRVAQLVAEGVAGSLTGR